MNQIIQRIIHADATNIKLEHRKVESGTVLFLISLGRKPCMTLAMTLVFR